MDYIIENVFGEFSFSRLLDIEEVKDYKCIREEYPLKYVKMLCDYIPLQDKKKKPVDKTTWADTVRSILSIENGFRIHGDLPVNVSELKRLLAYFYARKRKLITTPNNRRLELEELRSMELHRRDRNFLRKLLSCIDLIMEEVDKLANQKKSLMEGLVKGSELPIYLKQNYDISATERTLYNWSKESPSLPHYSGKEYYHPEQIKLYVEYSRVGRYQKKTKITTTKKPVEKPKRLSPRDSVILVSAFKHSIKKVDKPFNPSNNLISRATWNRHRNLLGIPSKLTWENIVTICMYQYLIISPKRRLDIKDMEKKELLEYIQSNNQFNNISALAKAVQEDLRENGIELILK